MVPALPDEIRRGRTSRWRYVPLPQWALLMADLSDAALRVYALLLAHVNAADGDGEAWPQQQSLAAMLGRHRNSIGRAIKEL
ncbi:helix-turn-helix domain-containing protein, partial [Algoriphagus aestuarii]|nr:helix-turn-helix domain-containing protein [Algoriphagus aestuarii]